MELPVVLIPAYKPDQNMIDFIKSLQAEGFGKIMVIDDGSGSQYTGVFAQAADMGCIVLVHGINMGKGRAMKTGFNYCLVEKIAAGGVITADADGQHTASDCRKIASVMAESPEAFVLGVRMFTGKVPLRNRLGNGITRFFFSLIHGSKVQDTQTGLRGIPSMQLPLFLSLSGERYDYEMNMLLAVRPNDICMIQIPIETIYIEGNKHSHYKVLVDSVRIYRLLVKFVGSSLIATLIDYLVFTLMTLNIPNQVFFSVAVARAASSSINYAINKHLVFKQKNVGKSAIVRYYALVVAILLGSYGLIKLFHGVLDINLYVSKIIADAILSSTSFIIQREFVYKSNT